MNEGAVGLAQLADDLLERMPGSLDRDRPRSPILQGAWNSHKHRCDDEVARYERTRSIGGSADVVEALFQVRAQMACPHPDVRCLAPVGRVRSSGESRSGRSFHSSGGGRGEDRTGELREPSLMPRDVDPRRMECWKRGAGTWPLRCGRRRPGTVPGRGEHRRPRGTEGTLPGRYSCVRNAVTPSRSGHWAGKSTVRRTQLLGGNRMTEKRTPVAERQQETATGCPAPPAGGRG